MPRIIFVKKYDILLKVKIEYLLFNVLVIVLPLCFSSISKYKFKTKRNYLLRAAFFSAIPFLVWDSLATDRYWYFNPQYILGKIPVINLPVEEILFFICIPFASGVIWEVLFAKDMNLQKRAMALLSPSIYVMIPVFIAGGVLLIVAGYYYGGITALVLGGVIGLDFGLGIRLMQQVRYYVFLLFYSLLNLVFNGYLTARPIVLYNSDVLLNVRVFTIPLEDFFYGIALITLVLVLYSLYLGRKVKESLLEVIIRKRLHNYIQDFKIPDKTGATILKFSKEHPPRVAVIGAGLAGLSAAYHMSERGFSVDIYEAERYIGGKCGAWNATLELLDCYPRDIAETSASHKKTPTRTLEIEHGFHGFFGNYYNFLKFFEEIGDVKRDMRQIDNYVILFGVDNPVFIKDVQPTPVVNMFYLRTKVLNIPLSIKDMRLFKSILPLLQYDCEKTHGIYDTISYKEFLDSLNIYPRLKDVISTLFTNFSRAFFASKEKLSAAEFIKSFHFYYFSQNKGLRYRYLNGSYENTFLNPVKEKLIRNGVKIYLNRPVSQIAMRSQDTGGSPSDNDVLNFVIDDTVYHNVIVASDVQATKKIVSNSHDIRTLQPQFASSMEHMHSGEYYAVLHVWLEGEIDFSRYPVFIGCQLLDIMDSITVKEKVDTQWQKWISDNTRTGKGHVLELHSYSVPSRYSSEREIIEAFYKDLAHYFPDFNNCKILYQHLMYKNNFTALHVGMHKDRPSPDIGIDGLYFAGDWVALPFPALLVEAAHTSGVVASNYILQRYNMPMYPVSTVPTKGVLCKR